MEELPMTGFQAAVITVMFLLNALDGYDALAIAFAAPGIAPRLVGDTGGLGIVISLGLSALRLARSACRRWPIGSGGGR